MPLRPMRSERLPGCEQQRREHEVVGVDDPLQLAVRRVQFAHERRQRDVDDRRVEVDREGRQQQRDEDQRPAIGLHVAHRPSTRRLARSAAPAGSAPIAPTRTLLLAGST